MSELTSFLAPKSIAVIGASDGTEKIGGRMMATLIRQGFPGALYPVNPGRPEVHGLKAYPSVADLPGPVDLAIVCIPATAVVAAAEACAAAGIRNLVVVSSGFAEEGGEGAERQRALLEAGKRLGLRICGPNTEGFYNVPARIAATFSPAVHADPGPAGPRRRIGIVAQSGGLGFALYHRGRAEGLDFSTIVSVGNQADLEVIDYAEALLDDPDTAVIILFVEGIKTPSKFIALADRAARIGKPIVIAKVGNSDAGKRAVASHTGSLSGAESAYDAVFDRYGVIRAHTPEEMLDIAAMFTRFPKLAGPRVAIVSTSGGAAAWLTDVCEANGLVLPEIDAGRQRRIREFLPSYGSANNPIDLTGQGMNGWKKSLEVLQDSPDFDAIIVAGSFAHEGRLNREGEAMRDIARACGKPIVLFSYTVPSERSCEMLAGWDMHAFTTMEGCGKALGAANRYRLFQERRAAAAGPQPNGVPLLDLRGTLAAREASVLCEYEASELLGAYSIPMQGGRLVETADEAVAAADALGWPVAIKVQSPQIPHKTEAKAVRLNLRDAGALRAAYDEVLASARAYAPDADIHGVLVQKMATPGAEFIAGVTRDPDFGPMVMCGLGGIYVELFKDVAFAPAPLSRDDALRMLRSLKSAPLLDGVRGGPGLDVEAMADLLVRLSRFAADAGGAVAEIDLNPVFLHPAGQGVTVVDGLIVTTDKRP